MCCNRKDLTITNRKHVLWMCTFIGFGNWKRYKVNKKIWNTVEINKYEYLQVSITKNKKLIKMKNINGRRHEDKVDWRIEIKGR